MENKHYKNLHGGGSKVLFTLAIALLISMCLADAALAADPVYDVQWTEWNPSTGVLTLKAGKSGEAGVPTATSGNIWRCDEDKNGWQRRKYGTNDYNSMYPSSDSNEKGIGDGIYLKVKRFVVDKSYDNFTPNSINFFFRDMANLEVVEGLEYMGSITSLDTYDGSKGEKGSLCRLFKGCKNLKFIQGMEGWGGNPTYMFEMFAGCENLLWVDIHGIKTDKVENMDNMFWDCKNMRKAWVGYKDFNQFYHGSWNNMFHGCTYVEGLFEYMPDDKPEETYAVLNGDMLAFFNDRHKIANYYYTFNLNTGSNLPAWHANSSSIKTVWFSSACHYYYNSGHPYYTREIHNHISPETCYGWFKDCSNLVNIYGVEHLSLSGSCAYMFYNCSKLKIESAQDIVLRNLPVSDLSYMFYNCTGLYGSLSFSSGNYSSFSSVTKNLSYMFYGCKNLTSINLGECRNRLSLVENTKSMFEGCSSLERILVYSDGPNFSHVTESTNMFKGCEKLKGGAGTSYDASNTDIKYAIEDRPLLAYNWKPTPGYFSAYKSAIYYGANFGGITEVSIEPYISNFTMDDEDFTFDIKIDQWLLNDGYEFRDVLCYGGNTSVSGHTVTVKKGSCSDISCIVRLKCPLKRVDLDPKSTPYNGSEIPFTLYRSLNGNNYALVKNVDYGVNSIKIKKGNTYETVSEIKEAGRYQISLYGKGENFTGSNIFEFTVTPLDITVVPENTTKTYGTKDPEIKYTIEGNLLSGDNLKGALSYDKSEGENVGKYAITIGSLYNPNYNITLADGEFEILPKELPNPTVLTTSQKYPYTGSPVKPTVYVFDGETKVPASEYSVSYRNNIEIGQGVFTITDNPGGNYVVSGSGSFTIADPSEFCKVDVKYHGFSSDITKTYYVITNQILPYGDLAEEGYTLLGLYTDASCNSPFDYQNTAITTNDLTLHAKWQINKHKLLLTVDGTEVCNETLEYGAPIIIPDQPAVIGKTFSWNMVIPTTMPDYDIVAEGSYVTNQHTITYTIDGEVYHKDEMIDFGTPIVILTTPMKPYYKFSGWTPSTLPAAMPDYDITVEGTFTPNKHTVTFVVDGSNIVVETQYGVAISSILPKKPGYKFEANGEYPATVPDQNIFISGEWKETTYFLTYLLNGKEYKKFEMHYGDAITLIAAPTKEGHRFSGWSEAPATMPDNSLTITGRFSAKEYTITFVIDGETYKTVTMYYGDIIIAPSVATKSGYTFSGWDNIPATMPDSDITITGSYTANNATPVSAIAESETAKVWSYNRTIFIETAPDTKYTIVDLQGRVITTSTTKSSHDEIQINQSGIMIVIIGNQSFKLAL
ncbi:MAG: InlB B-repeat-containing protein [Bacteroidales bacterium]|nr:InlB B-repeat-containing protein [Bacteroidales bacterium]